MREGADFACDVSPDGAILSFTCLPSTQAAVNLFTALQRGINSLEIALGMPERFRVPPTGRITSETVWKLGAVGSTFAEAFPDSIYAPVGRLWTQLTSVNEVATDAAMIAQKLSLMAVEASTKKAREAAQTALITPPDRYEGSTSRGAVALLVGGIALSLIVGTVVFSMWSK